jgi:hypothetical protein
MFTRWYLIHEFTAWALLALGATERPDLDGLLTVTPASPGGGPWGYDGDNDNILYIYIIIYIHTYVYIYMTYVYM